MGSGEERGVRDEPADLQRLKKKKQKCDCFFFTGEIHNDGDWECVHCVYAMCAQKHITKCTYIKSQEFQLRSIGEDLNPIDGN